MEPGLEKGSALRLVERLIQLLAGGLSSSLPSHLSCELNAVLAQLQQVDLEQKQCEEQHAQLKTLHRQHEQTLSLLGHYRELFEFAPDAYLVTSRAGLIEEANHTATQMLDVHREFLHHKPLPFFVCREDRAAIYSCLAMLSSERDRAQHCIVRLESRRGPSPTVSMAMTSILEENGKPARVSWLIRDISDLTTAREELRAERLFADSMIEAAPTLVLLLDSEGHLLRTNSSLEMVSGYTARELREGGCLTLFPPTAAEEMVHIIPELLCKGQTVQRIYPLLTREGRQLCVAWSCRLLESPDRKSSTMVAIGHDITALQEAQQQTLRLERLAAIGQMAGGLAHESRNALQRGQACLERLSWKLQEQPELLDLVHRAQRAHEDLVRLYDDVREYASALRLQLGSCSVEEIWRKAWHELEGTRAGRQAELHEQVEETDLTCTCDSFRLGQVFRNLFENALAACPGTVHITVRCVAAFMSGRPALRISVCDQGPGLSAEQRNRLFQPFFTTKVRGMGLGLAICKRIVEMHGGEMLASDAPGPGTEIVILLPRR